jgi:hypothetical protein
MMLEPLLGAKSGERVLMFLFARGEGYPREIARFFSTDYRPIRNQLERLEKGGVLCSHLTGKTRVFTLNPRYPFLNELRCLLEKALIFYPASERAALLVNRRRPRRSGKEL